MSITWYLILAHFGACPVTCAVAHPMLRDVTTTEPEPTIAILARQGDGGVEELPADRIDDLDRLAARDGMLLWVHLTRPTAATIERIGAEFGIHPVAIEDLRKPRQRPKVDTYDDQYHLVAYEAAPDTERGVAEIQLVIGRNWIVSVHWDPTPMADATHRRVAAGEDSLASSVAETVYSILDAVTDSYFPELDRLSDRIEALEDEVIEQRPQPETLREVLRIKRILLEQRRVLAPMRDMANALLRGDGRLVDRDTRPYYQDLYDHLVRVLDQLDLYRDLLAAVLDARAASVSNDLNATMRRLTAVTVVIMVPTLIAGIYGMNFRFMPELGQAWGYPFAIALMVGAAAAALLIFRQKGWF